MANQDASKPTNSQPICQPTNLATNPNLLTRSDESRFVANWHPHLFSVCDAHWLLGLRSPITTRQALNGACVYELRLPGSHCRCFRPVSPVAGMRVGTVGKPNQPASRLGTSQTTANQASKPTDQPANQPASQPTINAPTNPNLLTRSDEGLLGDHWHPHLSSLCYVHLLLGIRICPVSVSFHVSKRKGLIQ